ncbi:hypothetical protein LEM8419_00574 [Neolewinella maritima]|uniref:GIY-YIG domain-containing protein n=1 Tax=Neolewinella maritima TaxID=1383882 RepID=A0ABN8F4X9_9BACT|nr:hypothetical protein LEM8419_00574 [Neolewinella maritima]
MDSAAYIYILKSEAGKFYIGYTQNLAERIRTHQANEGSWTRGKGPWTLRYYESFDSDTLARSRELHLKKTKNKNYLDWLIMNGPGTSVG